MSSLYVIQVECFILRIKHLFQNGRLLLTCIILLSPTSGDPDVFDITRSPALIPFHHTSVVPIVNKHFKTVFLRFRTSVLMLKRSSSHSVAVIYSSFSRLFPKIRRDCRLLTLRSLCFGFCVVVKSHSSHSYANFFFAGFVVFTIFVRFV